MFSALPTYVSWGTAALPLDVKARLASPVGWSKKLGYALGLRSWMS